MEIWNSIKDILSNTEDKTINNIIERITSITP